MIVEVDSPEGEHIRQVGVAVKLSRTPGAVRSLAPRLGQNSEEILTALGFDSARIAQLREEGAVK